MQYDIFISYRRKSGEDKARILNQFLSTIGYRVFFDHESGLTGEFETEILAAVEIAPVFLMLLTPGCLDECKNEDDWVRREIERATLFKKEIIPIRPNYNFEFTKLPEGIPDYVKRLSKLEFAEIDFHKNFKSSANSMVEVQIKKVVQPSIVLTDTGEKGAKIHFFSDISCRIFHYGSPVAITDATDCNVGAILRLLKGNHKLEYKSIEHEADAYSETYYVPDNDYESFVNIELQPIRDKRKKVEEELKAAEEQKAAEEKERRSSNKDTIDNSNYDYDLFFCYSRHDSEIVRQTYQVLSQAGYRCWFEMDAIAAGDQFKSVIAHAISRSKCILFFSSESSNNSEWVIKEVSYALHSQKVIIPVKLDDSDYNESIEYELILIDFARLQSRKDLNRLLTSISHWVDN